MVEVTFQFSLKRPQGTESANLAVGGAIGVNVLLLRSDLSHWDPA